MPQSSFDTVQIGVSNQSLNKAGVKTQCHKCFSVKYGYHVSCTPLTTLLMQVLHYKKGKKRRILLHMFLHSSGLAAVNSVSAR